MRTVAAMAVLAVLVSACRAEIEVDIDVSADGSGTVSVELTLDEEILASAPELADVIRIDDVVAAGWDVQQGPSLDGGLKITAVRNFASIERLPDLLNDVDGAGGLFTGAVLDVGRRGATVTYRLVVSVELDRTVLDLISADTAALLDGHPFGVPVEELENRAGGSLDEALGLVVSASVPGGQGRLPEVGTLTLNEGGSRELVVSGELFNESIEVADQAALEARDAVPRSVRRLVMWWAFLAVAALLIWRLFRRFGPARLG